MAVWKATCPCTSWPGSPFQSCNPQFLQTNDFLTPEVNICRGGGGGRGRVPPLPLNQTRFLFLLQVGLPSFPLPLPPTDLPLCVSSFLPCPFSLLPPLPSAAPSLAPLSLFPLSLLAPSFSPVLGLLSP